MLGTPFTKPVGAKVLEDIFNGNKEAMYKYACEYVPGEGGPTDLGAEFRSIIKNRNRTEWWRGCKIWLEAELDKAPSSNDEDETASLRKVFTRPTGEKVLSMCFSANAEEMYDYACKYIPGKGGPTDLGAVFRGIIKTVNREHWWRGCKKWLEDEKGMKPNQTSSKSGFLSIFRK